jgi:hypothetical protein
MNEKKKKRSAQFNEHFESNYKIVKKDKIK